MLRRVAVGRLPVGMVALGGDVFALVHTDKAVYQQTAGPGRGATFAGLDECPEAFAAGAIWVLTAPDCSSASSRLVRLDLRGGPRPATAPLGPWGAAVAFHGGRLFTTHAQGDALVVVDARSLAVTSVDVPGASLWAVATAGGLVHAGGRLGEDNAQGLVVSTEPRTLREVARAEVGERVQAVAADASHVVAVGEAGGLWVFSADGPRLQRSIALSTGLPGPRAAILVGDELVVTSQRYQGENEAVMIVSGWRPDDAATAPEPAPAPAAAPPRPVPGTAAPARPPRPGPGVAAPPPLEPAAAPAGIDGVDCSSPRTPVERTICSDPRLRRPDAKIADAVVLRFDNIVSAAVGGTPAEQRTFLAEQARWRRTLDRCGTDAGCLRAAYQVRQRNLDELNQPE